MTFDENTIVNQCHLVFGGKRHKNSRASRKTGRRILGGRKPSLSRNLSVYVLILKVTEEHRTADFLNCKTVLLLFFDSQIRAEPFEYRDFVSAIA